MFIRGFLFLMFGSVSLFSKSVYWIGLDWRASCESATKHYKEMASLYKNYNIEIKFLLPKHLLENIEYYKRVFVDDDTAYVVDDSLAFQGFSLFFHKEYLSVVPYKKRVAILWEPPTVQPMTYSDETLSDYIKVFTWNNHLIDGKKFIKIYHHQLHPMIKNRVRFNEKKFTCMIFSNKSSNHPLELYSLRQKIIQFFSKNTTDFDLYGWGWANNTPNYKGCVGAKFDTIKNYKFCFAMENTRGLSGYLTEKIWDVFQAGSIPVYWGDSDVEKEIPSDCYVDFRKFAGMNELVRYLQAMDQEEYERRVLCIKEFLQTDVAKKYSNESFYQSVVSVLGK